MFRLLKIPFTQDFGFPFTQIPFTQYTVYSRLRISVYSRYRFTQFAQKFRLFMPVTQTSGISFTQISELPQMLKSVLKQLHSALEPKDILKKFACGGLVYSDPVYLLF